MTIRYSVIIIVVGSSIILTSLSLLSCYHYHHHHHHHSFEAKENPFINDVSSLHFSHIKVILYIMMISLFPLLAARSVSSSSSGGYNQSLIYWRLQSVSFLSIIVSTKPTTVYVKYMMEMY